MRPKFEGSLPHNVRAVIEDLNSTINLLECLLEYEHQALVIRQLRPAHGELINARASLALAAVAADRVEAA